MRAELRIRIKSREQCRWYQASIIGARQQFLGSLQAHLVRLEVSEEVPKVNQQVGQQLSEQVATQSGGAPLTGAAQMALKMREDVVTDGFYPDKVLSNAPERIGDFYVVPKVVE